MKIRSGWHEVVGVNGKTYHNYFFDVVWIFGERKIDVLHKHNLMTVLDKLSILQYVYDTEGVYEIVVPHG